MAVKNKCEVAFPLTGESHFLRFTIADLSVLEDEFGQEFFTEIETKLAFQSPKVTMRCLEIGLKDTVQDAEFLVFPEVKDTILDGEFTIEDAAKPILSAIGLSWLGKDYDELLAEAEENRKKKSEEDQKKALEVVKTAKEVAEDAGVPFDQEGSLAIVLKLLTEQGLTPSSSGS